MRKCVCLAALAVAAFATGASAQDIPGFDRDPQTDMRASVGISIPFGGGSRDRANTQPRFNLQIETGEADWQSRADSFDDPRLDPRRDLRRAQFSLTMEEEPRFLVNGIAPLEVMQLQAGQDTDQDGEPLGTGDGPYGGDEPNEPDAFDHAARGALFVGGVVATVAVVGLVVIYASCNNGGCSE